MHRDRPPGPTTGDRLRGPDRIEMAIAEVRPPTPDRHHREVDPAGRRPPRHLVHGVVEIGVTGQPHRAAAVTDQVTHRRGPWTPPPAAVVAGSARRPRLHRPPISSHRPTARQPHGSRACAARPRRPVATPPASPGAATALAGRCGRGACGTARPGSAESHGPTGNRPPMRRTMPTLPTWLNTGSLRPRTPASSTSTQEWPSHVAWRRPVTGAGGVRLCFHDHHSAAYEPGRNQLVVAARSRRSALLDDGDPVRVVRREQPVGDRDDRPPSSTAASERSRCRAARDRSARSPRPAPGCAGRRGPAGPARAAGPAPGERSPAGADLGVEAVGQRVHPLQRVDRVERRADVVVVGAVGAASARFSRSVPTKTWCSWVTSATWPAGRPAAARQPDAADGHRPVRGAWMPASSRPRVDLPAPDGPTIASRSPARTSRSTPCSTSRPRHRRIGPRWRRAARRPGRPVDLRSSGTLATPSSRASERRRPAARRA